MRLLRCLIMILATLSMAGFAASATVDHGHAMHVAAQHHDHRHADVASTHVGDGSAPCAGHHGSKAHHDGKCCGMACCGPSCVSPATPTAANFRSSSTIVSRGIPSADALADGTPYSLPARTQTRQVVITARRDTVSMATLNDVLGGRAARVKQFILRQGTGDEHDAIEVTFTRLTREATDDLVAKLRATPGVIEIEAS